MRATPIVALLCTSCGPALVIAVAGGGDSGGGTEPPPIQPTAVTALVEGPRRIDILWSDAANNELGFRVERGAAGGPFVVVARVGPDTPAHSDTTVEPRTTYVYRVVAFNGGGETTSAVTPAVTTPALLGLRALEPDSGLAEGGETVRLLGTGLQSQRPNTVPVLGLGGATAGGIRIVDDGTLEFLTPGPAQPGAVGLSLHNGYETASLAGAYTYFSSPPAFAPNDRRINAGTAGVATAADPEISCSGSRLYAAWQDQRSGPGYDIAFNHSTDGGLTWQTSDRRLDTDPPGAADSTDPELACIGDAVYAVWTDARHGQRDIYCNRSLDAGATWLDADVRLDGDTPGSADSVDPEIACSGDNVYVVWWDNRNGLFDVYFNRSLDRGRTWLPAAIRLETDPRIANSGDPSIACDGDRVYVAWVDQRNGRFDVYGNRSLDAGATWLASDQRLDTSDAGDAMSLRMCAVGGTVVVVWADTRGGQADIHYNRSIDEGATWMPTDGRLDTDAPGSAGSVTPQIACSGSFVYVAWFDGRNSAQALRCNRSLDGGATWLAQDIRLDDGRRPELHSVASVACNRDRVHVVWSAAATAGGAHDIFVGTSPDAGATWSQVQVDRGVFDSRSPQICMSGARVHVIWRDSRDGATTPGVYFNTRVP